MKSAALGRSTSLAEVTNVSPHGFWLFVGERELFVPFKEFPWFLDASVREITTFGFPVRITWYSARPRHRPSRGVHRASGEVSAREPGAAEKECPDAGGATPKQERRLGRRG